MRLPPRAFLNIVSGESVGGGGGGARVAGSGGGGARRTAPNKDRGSSAAGPRSMSVMPSSDMFALVERGSRARRGPERRSRSGAAARAARVERVGPRLVSSHGGSRAAPRGFRLLLQWVGAGRLSGRRRGVRRGKRCAAVDETACVHSVRGWQTRCLGLFFQDPAELAPCKTLASCVRAAVCSSGDSCRASSNV